MGRGPGSTLARSRHQARMVSSCTAGVANVWPLANTDAWSSMPSQGITSTTGRPRFARESALSKGLTAVPVSHGREAVVMMVKCRPGLRRSDTGVHVGMGPREKSGDSASASSRDPPSCCTIRAPLFEAGSSALGDVFRPLPASRCREKAETDSNDPRRPLRMETSCWNVHGASSSSCGLLCATSSIRGLPSGPWAAALLVRRKRLCAGAAAACGGCHDLSCKELLRGAGGCAGLCMDRGAA
mmetsp:Transcript_68370/g.154807  ORF Transcript_68370/g.154807 Transcript_68370/m.154807 type:complete len:242 (-) Transcript_68370:103-828(-)